MSKVLDRITINALSFEERVQYFLERAKEWHQRKHDEAMAAGITLLHIWDSRWNSEYKLVYLNIINNLINGNHDKIAHLIIDNIWLNHS